MQITDPIADLLTRIRNASNANHPTVEVPASNMKISIVKILLDEGYILKYEVIKDSMQGVIKIWLKYSDNKKQVIKGIKRISKPGLRVYVPKEELPRVLKGLGVAIVSTSKGIMTDKKARRENVGGEVLAFVW
ncbi:MAG: 30S ribosomal protein S8 [Clostridiales bacterium]|jgi:small subunit ribosomal protein S8|nr:30S ribosomal protein S8 [Clostridiales bacterium]